jgi:ribosomal protein S18 acetylase RimI-like enzyme
MELVQYIYLDMVTYNHAAAKFYQKNGFNLMRTKKDHYTIEGNSYDAYVYVWHGDGKRRRAVKEYKSPW